MSHSPSLNVDLSDANTRLGSAAITAQAAALVIGIVGMVASAVIGFTGAFDVTHSFFMKSWLQNYIFVLSISLGAFFFVFIQHLTRAGWSTTIRRPAEVIAANLQWAWVGMIPIAALWIAGAFSGHGSDDAGHGAGWGPGILFPWADLEAMRAHNPDEYHLVKNKSAYLNAGFFWIRVAIYMLFWGFASRWYFRSSLEQDRTGDIRITQRLQKWSGPTALAFGLTITFAAIDWIMSLSPAWFSTMFGVYFFAGCCTGGFAAIIIVLIRLQENGRMRGIVTKEHYQDVGKLLFAFGMIFMATDPVSASMTNTGKWIFGGLIGVMTVLIRVVNPAFPEGVMLAILFANLFSPLIDWSVVQSNIRRRRARDARA